MYATSAIQLHGSTNSTVSAPRQCYCIPAARRVVAKLLQKYVELLEKPFFIPDPSPLSLARVQVVPLFSVTRVDFMGTMYVRKKSAVGDTSVCSPVPPPKQFILKSWLILQKGHFCRLSEGLLPTGHYPIWLYQIMHLPTHQRPINWTNYSSHLLKVSLSALIHKGTMWRFILKRALWYGAFGRGWSGWWRCLKILGQTLITLHVLQTTAVEVEAVLNDCPLIFLSSTTELRPTAIDTFTLVIWTVDCPSTTSGEECRTNWSLITATLQIS